MPELQTLLDETEHIIPVGSQLMNILADAAGCE